LNFSELPLDHRIKKSLEDKRLTELTLIQEKVIAPALKGNDIVASSKTGSGKTLAFLVPCIHRLLTSRALSKRDPRVIILAPTRELAKQVFLEAKWLTSGMPLSCQLIVGGENYNEQIKTLRKNPQVIIGTAGRIADHLNSKSFFIEGLELLIMDEADRMLDLGFTEQLSLINQLADHRKRQTMMFSATVGKIEVNKLAESLLKSPVRVAVGEATEQHRDIKQTYCFTDHIEQKSVILEKLLSDHTYTQSVIFAATRQDTERLAAQLNKQGFNAVPLHAELAQNVRSNVMNAFSKGQHSLLVCTDVASRGLDLPRVELVINFDLPKHAEEYIHRIGRTGRAGKQGAAISLVGPRDWQSFVNIRALLDYVLEEEKIDGVKTKFSGHDLQRPNSSSPNKNKRKPNSDGNPSAQLTKPRVKAMHGKDVGDAPMLRKKKPKDVEDFDNEED
jgi:superfamily II DNA/RNA helicase